MIFFVIFFLAMLCIIFGQNILIKECVLYPILVFMFYIILSYIELDYWNTLCKNNFWRDIIVCISIILGLILYYITVKKINKNIGKIDIYIYIYTLLNSYIMIAISGGVVFEGEELYWSLFTIVFYFINIIYFYYFRKNRLLKIVIMPTLISVLSWVPIFIGWAGIYWEK